jgi:hypothetical protein
MRTKLGSKILATILLATILLAAMGAASATVGGKKPAASPTRLVSHMAAIVPGQSAQVNIVNWADTSANLEVALLGDDGKPLFDTTVQIDPGQSFSDAFGYICCGGSRVEVRGLVQPADAKGNTNMDQVVATLEVFDTKTGTTGFILPYVLLPAIRAGGSE